MDSDRTVSKQAIGAARELLSTRGWEAIGNKWAASELELYVHMLASSVRVSEFLRREGVREAVVTTVHREVMSMLLECAEALRQSNRELWESFLPQTSPADGGAS